jgi:hypothetical protein
LELCPLASLNKIVAIGEGTKRLFRTGGVMEKSVEGGFSMLHFVRLFLTVHKAGD